MIKTYYSIYEKILKTIYVPLFIKEPCWEFEHEFRMFLLKHRMTREGMIKMEDFLDKNNNVNLSNAITGIYLGENFYQNKQADVILDDIVKIAESKNITVYKKDEIIYEPSAGK